MANLSLMPNRASSSRVLDAEPEVASPGSRQSDRLSLPDVIALALAPPVAFFGLGVRAMSKPTVIDPYLYTAYAENGHELLQRFGAANYFWPRVGFILPARASYLLFGAVPGFFAFRYLLALIAIVPAYLLLKRLHGTVAGWIAVAVILTSPLILTAWGTDYPDSSAVSYLIAAICCLVMPAAAPRRRLLWVASAGAFASMAVNSQVIAVLTIGSFVAAYAGIHVLRERPLLRERFRQLIPEAVAGIGGALVVTVALVVATAISFGHWNIFAPTLHAIALYRRPGEIAIFHSTTWRFLIDDPYLLVPPAIVGTWLAVSWWPRRSDGVTVAEWTVVGGTLLAFLVHTALQFLGQNWTLEYYLYTSMLWSGVSLLTALTLARILGLLPRHRLLRWLPVLAVVGIPLAIRPFRLQLMLDLLPALAITAALVAVGLITRLRILRPVGGVAALVAVVALSYILVAGQRLDRPLFPGQRPYFTPDYGTVLLGSAADAVDIYGVESQLKDVVPSLQQTPGDLLLWWPAKYSDPINGTSAQYLWQGEALPPTLPRLDAGGGAVLAARHPRFLVLLSDSGEEFAAATEALQGAGQRPSVWRQATLAYGAVKVHVIVLELKLWAPAGS